MHLPLRTHANVELAFLIAIVAIVEAGLGPGILGREVEPGRKNLFHEQAGGNRLEVIVDRVDHERIVGRRFRNQVGEAGARLAGCITGGAANDLDDLGQAGTIADRQGVFAPYPVEAFLGHAQRDDDVDKITVLACLGRFQRCHHAVAFSGVIIDQIGNFDDLAASGADEVKAGFGIDALPIAEVVHDVLGLAVLSGAGALFGIDRRDVDDRLHRRIEQRRNLLGIGAGVEAVSDVERLEVLVPVELLVVGVGDRLEPVFILWGQHGDGIAAEIAAGHGDDMRLVPSDQLRKLSAEAVPGVCGNMVELVNRDQPVVERFRSQLVKSETEGRMGADQHSFLAGEEFANGLHFGFRHLRIVSTRRVAQVPLRGDNPVVEESVLAERFAAEARADGAFRHADDGLADTLIGQLVQRHEHQRARFAGSWRRFDQQILLAALFVHLRLHWPHSQLVGLRRHAGVGGLEGHGRDDLVVGHAEATFGRVQDSRGTGTGDCGVLRSLPPARLAPPYH